MRRLAPTLLIFGLLFLIPQEGQARGWRWQQRHQQWQGGCQNGNCQQGGGCQNGNCQQGGGCQNGNCQQGGGCGPGGCQPGGQYMGGTNQGNSPTTPFSNGAAAQDFATSVDNNFTLGAYDPKTHSMNGQPLSGYYDGTIDRQIVFQNYPGKNGAGRLGVRVNGQVQPIGRAAEAALLTEYENRWKKDACATFTPENRDTCSKMATILTHYKKLIPEFDSDRPQGGPGNHGTGSGNGHRLPPDDKHPYDQWVQKLTTQGEVAEYQNTKKFEEEKQDLPTKETPYKFTIQCAAKGSDKTTTGLAALVSRFEKDKPSAQAFHIIRTEEPNPTPKMKYEPSDELIKKRAIDLIRATKSTDKAKEPKFEYGEAKKAKRDLSEDGETIDGAKPWIRVGVFKDAPAGREERRQRYLILQKGFSGSSARQVCWAKLPLKEFKGSSAPAETPPSTPPEPPEQGYSPLQKVAKAKAKGPGELWNTFPDNKKGLVQIVKKSDAQLDPKDAKALATENAAKAINEMEEREEFPDGDKWAAAAKAKIVAALGVNGDDMRLIGGEHNDSSVLLVTKNGEDTEIVARAVVNPTKGTVDLYTLKGGYGADGKIKE